MLVKLPRKMLSRFLNEFEYGLTPEVWKVVSDEIDQTRDIKDRRYYFSWMWGKESTCCEFCFNS